MILATHQHCHDNVDDENDQSRNDADVEGAWEGQPTRRRCCRANGGCNRASDLLVTTIANDGCRKADAGINIYILGTIAAGTLSK